MVQAKPAQTIHRLDKPGARYERMVVDALRDRQQRLHIALQRMACCPLPQLARLLTDALRCGGTVLIAGNGGSAAEAQHFAAELVGRFKMERRPFAALALSTDSSIVTAIANDYGYEHVFARQILALGRPGDVLLCFSTSGESENLIRAAMVARDRGIQVAVLTGDRSSRLEHLAELAIRVPSDDTALVQELHTMTTHILCDIIETELGCREEPS